MSSPILPPQGPIVTGSAGAIGASRRLSSVAGTNRISSGQPPVSLDTFPSTPPAEVLDQIAATAEAYAQLTAQGQELHFTHDEQSGRAAILLRDQSGHALRTLSPTEAIDIAAGKPLS